MLLRMLPLGMGLAIGYVLGTRAGRERYDQLRDGALSLWNDPRVARTRRDVEAYARQQAPIIRDRAEAAVKAAPGVAKDAAGKVAAVAKDAADTAAQTAKDVAGQVSSVARDAAGQVSDTAKDVAAKAQATAKDVAAKAQSTADDLRGRGEDAVETAVQRAGRARDEALEDDRDEEHPRGL